MLKDLKERLYAIWLDYEFEVKLSVVIGAVFLVWLHAVTVEAATDPVDQLNREAHQGIMSKIPQEDRSQIEMCLWEGAIASAIMNIRKVDGDPLGLFHEKVARLYDDDHFLRDIVHFMGDYVYQIPPISATVHEVGTKWILVCFEEGFSAYKIIEGRNTPPEYSF